MVGVGVEALTYLVYCLSYYVVSSLAPKLKLSYSLVCPLFLLSQHSSLDFVRSLWHLKGGGLGRKETKQGVRVRALPGSKYHDAFRVRVRVRVRVRG
jgi:hypothetical protein